LFSTATPPLVSPLSLHDALPIFCVSRGLVDPVVDADHALEPVAGVIESIAARRGQHRIAGDGEQRADLTVSRCGDLLGEARGRQDRKSTRLNSSHDQISYAVFCL